MANNSLNKVLNFAQFKGVAQVGGLNRNGCPNSLEHAYYDSKFVNLLFKRFYENILFDSRPPA